jgi:hypothetical protein
MRECVKRGALVELVELDDELSEMMHVRNQTE